MAPIAASFVFKCLLEEDHFGARLKWRPVGTCCATPCQSSKTAPRVIITSLNQRVMGTRFRDCRSSQLFCIIRCFDPAAKCITAL